MITYKLAKTQESFINKKLLPMLNETDEEKIIWKGDTYHVHSVKMTLRRIVEDKEYNTREAELLNDLRIVYQKTKR